MTLVRVTDLAGAGSATVEHYEVSDALAPWFDSGTEETSLTITRMQDALNADRREVVDALSQALNVQVEYLT